MGSHDDSRQQRRPILAAHLVFTGYAHWLPNDLRGSGSEDLRKDDLKSLGEILPGRQYPQPPREQVKQFYQEAEPILEHPRLWFDEARRNAIAKSFGEAARKNGYTLWAFAICSNHAHGVARAHRDHFPTMWQRLADSARAALQTAQLVPFMHPVWSHRPNKVYLYTPDEVWGRIDYVNKNPMKEGLPVQHWDFVTPCPLRRT